MKLPFTKPKVREKQDDEFTSSEGVFKYSRKWKVSGNYIFNLYNKFFSKKIGTKANLNDLKKVKEWKTDFNMLSVSERWLLEKRMFKALDWEHILKQVREDIPGFVVYGQHLTTLYFKKINDDEYEIYAEITGTCNND